MTIIQKEKLLWSKKHSINIDGPSGNAFYILGRAKSYADQLGLDSETILKEMKSGDYIHLLAVFESQFGYVCDIETENEDLVRDIRTRSRELYNYG